VIKNTAKKYQKQAKELGLDADIFQVLPREGNPEWAVQFREEVSSVSTSSATEARQLLANYRKNARFFN